MRHMDDAGQQVANFMGEVVNFTRIGELVDETLAMARSQAWRRYVTGIGPAEWRQCEFDYFLIACDVPYDDAARVLAWGKAGAEIGAMMKPDAPKQSRRSLDEAGLTYQGAGPESLQDRAARLGWVNKKGQTRAPISPRALSTVKDAKGLEARAADARAERIKPARRAQLDKLAASIRSQVPDETDRRYLIDHIRPPASKGPRSSVVTEGVQWRAEAKTHDYNAIALAEVWGVSRSQASRRLREIRDIPAPPERTRGQSL